jgi:hypothetical protein
LQKQADDADTVLNETEEIDTFDDLASEELKSRFEVLAYYRETE